jgi:predicted nucleic acid-binding Zn ribbon protein
MSDAPLKECPKCNQAALVRLVSGGAGVIYKGEGWYVTDYSKKSTGGKETPPPSSEGAGTATETTSAQTSSEPDAASAPVGKTGS